MDLSKASIPRLLWYYSLPSLVGTVANALYNIIDRIYIGQGVGALAISGLAVTFPIMNLLGAFGMLVGHGAAAQVSLLLGKGDTRNANAILPNTLFLSLLFYVVVSSLCFIFLDPILYAFGASEQTIPYAREYLRIIIPGHIFTSLSYAYTNIMRASGHPMRAMNTLLLGALLNVVLDPIFIFGFNLGIRGAAYATVLSMLISAAWILHYFFKKENTLNFRSIVNSQQSTDANCELCIVNCALIKSILSIGLSSFLLHVAGALVNVLMNHTLQRHGGDLAIGAFGIITSFTSLVIMAIVGMSQGMQPIVGYNYGAGKFARVRTTLKYCISIATLITSLGWILAMACPQWIARSFTSDPTLIDITIRGIRIYCCTYFIVGSHIIITNYFQSIGRASVSIFLSMSRQFLVLIPFILLFPPLFGLNGAWLAQPVSNIIAVLTAIIILWRHLRTLSS